MKMFNSVKNLHTESEQGLELQSMILNGTQHQQQTHPEVIVNQERRKRK